MSPRETAAGKCLEAIMASLIVIALIVLVAVVLFGAFLRLSFAIGREDRRRTLGFDAPSRSAQAARTLVGVGRRNQD
jgi:uncharacterized membrane protein YdfJ with MMPL/SSD domain